MQSQRGLLLAVLDEVNAAIQTATNEDVCHWHRHSVWISAIGLSVASWRKKKRSCGSDKSAHDLGRDKSKNASILRKYGSIVWLEKTSCLFWFLHKYDFIKNITCGDFYTNITSILCFVWRKCNSERISFHL